MAANGKPEDIVPGDEAIAHPPWRRLEAVPKPVLAVFAAIVAVKLGVLLIFGPARQPDTFSYLQYADAILSGDFYHVDLAHDPMPVTLRRAIGIPAIVAAAKVVASSYWAWAVVLLQYAMSLWATVMVYRLARAFHLGVWLSLGVVAAQATSMQFVVDQAVLSDSLAGSTVTIATCVLALIALRREPASLWLYLGSGVLIAAAFLIRDVMAYMAAGLFPLIAAAAAVQRPRLRQFAAGVLVFVPLIASFVAYTQWNRSRVGAPIVTSSSLSTLFDALTEAAVYDPTIYDGATPIDDIGRRILPKMRAERYGYEDEASEYLLRVYGWDAIRQSHEATLAYLRGWRDHPYAMVRHVLYHMSETQLHQAVRPIETVRDVLLWNTGSSHDFAAERAVRRGEWRMILPMLVNWICETASVAVFCAFLVITPIRLLREGFNAETGVSIGFWCFYLTVGGLYAAVHLEPRYLTPVVAGSIVIGVVNIVRTVELYRRPAVAQPPRQSIA
jgi:4-amino-4-deoxy-L-arabinose transferase-like glycosyltransferase